MVIHPICLHVVNGNNEATCARLAVIHPFPYLLVTTAIVYTVDEKVGRDARRGEHMAAERLAPG